MLKAINDATQSKMRDFYQYIIALKDYFCGRMELAYN